MSSSSCALYSDTHRVYTAHIRARISSNKAAENKELQMRVIILRIYLFIVTRVNSEKYLFFIYFTYIEKENFRYFLSSQKNRFLKIARRFKHFLNCHGKN